MGCVWLHVPTRGIYVLSVEIPGSWDFRSTFQLYPLSFSDLFRVFHNE